MDWKEKLTAVSEQAATKNKKQGYLESETEQEDRYLFELTESKKILEQQLGKPMDFLCWPGGGYNQNSKELALNIYTAVTLGSADKSPVKNRVGEDARFIRRVGVPCLERGGRVHYLNGRYFVYFLDEFRGQRFARRRRQCLKLLNMVRLKWRLLFDRRRKP
jgi:hypothetical protein